MKVCLVRFSMGDGIVQGSLAYWGLYKDIETAKEIFKKTITELKAIPTSLQYYEEGAASNNMLEPFLARDFVDDNHFYYREFSFGWQANTLTLFANPNSDYGAIYIFHFHEVEVQQ